jgi:ferredoxin-thioredoxin reductase catalytic chain
MPDAPAGADPAAFALRDRLRAEAEPSGYRLNPDGEFTLGLMEGLLANRARYGYPSCPCRLASGDEAADRDIVCPCDYRDADVDEFGACYCGLYVSEDVSQGRRRLTRVPERRPAEGGPGAGDPAAAVPASGCMPSLPYPVWRCRVCGYLCARDAPPGVCPVCKAPKERFERFL